MADAELKLATMLIEQRATDHFRPEAYEDEVKKRIQEQLKRKIETGEEISTSPKPRAGEVIDLMEALRRSLSKQGGASSRKAPPPLPSASPPGARCAVPPKRKPLPASSP